MRTISHTILLLLLFFTPLRDAHAAQTPTPTEFRNYDVVNGFPESLTFKIEICNAPENGLVYLYYKIAQSSWIFSSDKIFSDGLTDDGCQRRRKTIFTRDEPPMLDIKYYWLVRFKGGEAKSLQQEYIYEDPRFEWNVLQNEDVAVHWHDRPEEFGKKAFDLAVRSVKEQQDLYRWDLKHPVQIVIENTDEEFKSWQFNPDPYTGGLAVPWYGMTVQLVEENEEEWLNEIIPHEISHLYFYQVTIGSDAEPLVWLDEGLAVYNEFSDHQYEDEFVRAAVMQDRLIPLFSLREGFRAENTDVDLAYAEGYYVVIYILEVHGEEKLAQLLQEYDRGKEHDEAFKLAFNQSLDEFEQDWETWVKTKLRANIPAAMTPPVQQQTSPFYPAHTSLVLLLLVCCFSLVGITGLGLVIYLWNENTAKKAES